MTRLFICILVLSCTLLSSVERIPADCQWLVQIDAQAILKSKVGEWIGQQMVKQPHAARLQMLQAISGLDLRRDIRSVTLCGVGADDDTGLVLVRGTFDAARIEMVAQAADGHLALPVGSRTIHTWLDKGKPAAGCLVASDLLVLAKTSTRIRDLIAAVDVGRDEVSGIVTPAGWEKSALMLGAAEQIADLAAGKPESAMLRNVRSLSVRIVEEGTDFVVEGRAIAASEAAAQQLLDAGRGLVALVQLQRPDHLDPSLLTAIQNAKMSREGPAVTIRVGLAAADALRVIEQGRAR